MSRILRRPMFRGGRVDSRGTGITSGLGYKQGGSVQARPGYFRGALVKGGLRYGKQGIDYLRNLLRGKPSTSKELVPSGYKFGDDFVSDFRKNLGVTGGLRDIPGVSPVLNFIARNPKKSLAGGALFGLSDYTDMLPSGESIGRALLPGKIEDVVFGEEEVTDNKEVLENTLNNLAKINLNNNNNNDNDDTVIDKKSMIKENTELFKELLGKDKARGQDISDMLLSFSGKALKDDATVKSAFGEFAAEEAKRPGRGRKIDDTAAAMAINAYIAGEKSAADLKKALTLKEEGLNMQQDILKERSLTSRINNDRTGRTVKQIVEGNTKEWMSDNNLSGVPNTVSSDDIKDPKLLVPENINEVFIDETTKEVFIVLKGTDKPVLQQLY